MTALSLRGFDIHSQRETSIVLSTYYKQLTGISDYFISGSTVFELPNIISEDAKEIWNKLIRFKKLQNNWDSYGALAPSIVAIEAAVDFIKEADSMNLPIYFTAPGRNGDVMVEFKGRGTKAAEIYFNPDGSNELLLFENDECKLESTLEKDKKALISIFK
ncbi:MAG: hypothetical protein H6562_11380 [Lewinellaceae bacterium]|nr:hypothetical protein [Lewinella sp.]MCB9279510.1 hypothetical protein [Lewinellaceae bacterium]